MSMMPKLPEGAGAATDSRTPPGAPEGQNDPGADTPRGQSGDDSNSWTPEPRSPFPDLPEVEIRRDKSGWGDFGESRERPDGTKYPHEGVDVLAPPGTRMTSPTDGRVEIRDSYKDGRYDNEYKNVWVVADDGKRYGLFYILPQDREGQPLIQNGYRVRAGDPIGTVQDRARRDPSGQMKNHVHVEIRDTSGQALDPMPQIGRWQRRPRGNP